jgi:DNA-directed RNA polymerase subunit RPC12/RpoP
MKECEKCNSKNMQVEVMWFVAGQQGKPPKQLDVAECKDCGHRWEVK